MQPLRIFIIINMILFMSIWLLVGPLFAMRVILGICIITAFIVFLWETLKDILS